MGTKRSLGYIVAVAVGKKSAHEHYLTYNQPRIRLVRDKNSGKMFFEVLLGKCVESPGTGSEVERSRYHIKVPVEWKVTVNPIIIEEQQMF
jgi:hypothetical protein